MITVERINHFPGRRSQWWRNWNGENRAFYDGKKRRTHDNKKKKKTKRLVPNYRRARKRLWSSIEKSRRTKENYKHAQILSKSEKIVMVIGWSHSVKVYFHYPGTCRRDPDQKKYRQTRILFPDVFSPERT